MFDSTGSIIACVVVCAVMLTEGLAHFLLWRREPRPISPRRWRELTRRWRYGSLVLSIPLLVMCLLLGDLFAALLYLVIALTPLHLLFGYGRVTEEQARANYHCDPHHCGRCNYDLTGNISGVCPECGWKLKNDVL